MMIGIEEIPEAKFREDMARLSIVWLKHCTTRTEPWKEGVELYCGMFKITYHDVPHVFEVVGLRKYPLWYVAQELYWVEGFSMSQKFIDLWNEIHNRKKYEDDPEREVYSHFYVPSIEYVKRGAML